MVKINISKNKEKLHIYKSPSSKSWCILLGTILMGAGSAAYFSSGGPILQTFYIFGFLTVGLCCLDAWQDCVIDRSLQRATFTSCNWYERLTKQPWRGHFLELPLTSLTLAKVVPHSKDGRASLLFVLRSGDTQAVLDTGNTPQERQHLLHISDEVNQFLHLDEMERMSWSDVSVRSSRTPSTSTSVSECLSQATSISVGQAARFRGTSLVITS